MQHPKADIDRLYVKRKEGGRCLSQIKAAYKAEIFNNAEYLNTNYKEEQFQNIVKSHETTPPNMNSTIKTSAKVPEELNENSGTKQDGIQHPKARLEETLKKKWKNKVMYGQ
jgi:hypothetical protein